jgi:hypothetical protein
MANLYKKIVPLSIRRFIRFLFCIIKYFPQHISCIVNHLSLEIRKRDMLDLAAITMVRNEAPYLREWIEYHRLIGVQKFYLYDNCSDDNIKEVLQPYINTGIVDYTYYPGEKAQVSGFNDAIKRFKNEAKYIAIIDIDEFIVPVQQNTIIEVINDVRNNAKSRKKLFAGLVIKWVNYGFDGHYSKPDGLVIENFKKTDGISLCHKTIINPRMVMHYQLHDGIYFLNRFGVDENGEDVTGFVEPSKATINKIRINHYWTKSYEEFKEKHNKGDALYGERNWTVPDYNPDYLSGKEDFVISRFIDKLKIIISE